MIYVPGVRNRRNIPTMENSQVAAVQFEPTVGKVDTNLERMGELADGLPASVGLAVFPELGVTGYNPDGISSIAEPIPGEWTEALIGIARTNELHLLAGVPERDGDRLFNGLVHVSPAGVESVYHKQRLWGDEAEVFTRGSGPSVAETPVGDVGLLVCYDLNFPELCLEYAESEVDVLAVSSAWRTSFLEDWRLLLRARALDGTCYTVGSNHVGDQLGRNHAGHSLVAGPTGVVLDETGTGAGSAVVTVKSAELDEARDRNPVRRDR